MQAGWMSGAFGALVGAGASGMAQAVTVPGKVHSGVEAQAGS
jgi:hypothetical protein